MRRDVGIAAVRRRLGRVVAQEGNGRKQSVHKRSRYFPLLTARLNAVARVLAFEKAARVSATPNDAGIRYEAIISSSSRDDKRITRAAGRVKLRKSWHSRW